MSQETRQNGQTYQKNYVANMEERVAIVPSPTENEAWINKILSEIINDALSDRQLVAFLTN